MALHVIQLPIANMNVPTSNGATLTTDVDTNTTKAVAQFAAGVNQYICGACPSMQSATGGSAVFRLRCRAAGTTGNVKFIIGAFQFGNGGRYALGAATTYTATTSVPGTAEQLFEVAITCNTMSADEITGFYIERNSSGGADTCTTTVEILAATYEYNVSGTVPVGGIFIPGNAFVIPAGNSASLGSAQSAYDNAGLVVPAVVKMPHSGTPTGQAKVQLPPNVAGQVQVTVIVNCPAVAGSAQTVKVHVDMGVSSSGGSQDPALTAQASWTFASNPSTSGTTILIDALRNAVISPGAGQFLSLQVVRDVTDTYAQNIELVGIILEFATVIKYPAIIPVDPGMWQLPSNTAPASFVTQIDTNTTKIQIAFVQSIDTGVQAYVIIPNTYLNGLQARITWYTPGSSGNVRWNVSWGVAAVGTASDPATSNAVEGTFVVSGADQMQESVLVISTSVVAGDCLSLVMYRAGAESTDTLPATVYLDNFTLEANPD